ncbi:hypothetical protein [Pseudomonas sp. NPDC099000]|uniref:hypothetical protein n=1 Tax=Pseudomonas sp. NPDC099000 TaxID=3364488 RepID=UPI00383A54C5
MNPGLLTTLDPATTALAIGAGIVILTEETQRLLHTRINRKAAMAAGIGALAMRAIDTGDTDGVLDLIAAMADDLTEELQNLASIAGQLKAAKAA